MFDSFIFMDIELYDFRGKPLRVIPTFKPVSYNSDLEEFARRTWKEGYKGWSSSYIPSLASVQEGTSDIEFHVDYTRYGILVGIIEAITSKQPFAPQGVSGLSVEIYARTLDGKLLLPKRSSKVKHAPHVYNAFAGWMSSMNIGGRKECEDPVLIQDTRLYDQSWQMEKEFEEESSLFPGNYQRTANPLGMTRGLSASFNFALPYVAEVQLVAEQIIHPALAGLLEFADGRFEHSAIATVPLEDISQLLRNQGQLQREDPASFQSEDSTELILLDQTIGSLVLCYERLTGTSLPADVIPCLEKGGIIISYKNLKMIKNI